MPLKTPYVASGDPPATKWGLALKGLPWKRERGEGNAAVRSSRALQINYSQGKELLNGSPPSSPLPMGNCRDSFSLSLRGDACQS